MRAPFALLVCFIACRFCAASEPVDLATDVVLSSTNDDKPETDSIGGKALLEQINAKLPGLLPFQLFVDNGEVDSDDYHRAGAWQSAVPAEVLILGFTLPGRRGASVDRAAPVGAVRAQGAASRAN